MNHAVINQYPFPEHINARLDAKEQGETFYKGRICLHDGTQLRYVQDDLCRMCAKRMRVRDYAIEVTQ